MHKSSVRKPYKFIKYSSLYDESVIVYALEQEGMEKEIDGFKFIEVTSDFERVQYVRADSLKAIGSVVKHY